MAELPQVLHRYQQAFSQGSIESIKRCYASDVIYFDPLYGYLHGDQVGYMWASKFAEFATYTISTGELADQGDGYYNMKYDIAYTSRSQMSIKMAVQCFFKIDDERIVEQSEAFSVHELLRQERGLIGHLMGWNRMMQQSRKNKARRMLLNFMST
jgi:hypothetical protein